MKNGSPSTQLPRGIIPHRDLLIAGQKAPLICRTRLPRGTISHRDLSHAVTAWDNFPPQFVPQETKIFFNDFVSEVSWTHSRAYLVHAGLLNFPRLVDSRLFCSRRGTDGEVEDQNLNFAFLAVLSKSSTASVLKALFN